MHVDLLALILNLLKRQLASVQFYLITTTILLLSREGLRRGCMRVKDGGGSGGGSSGSGSSGGARASERILSVAWLALPAGAAVAAAVCGFALRRAGPDAAPEYRWAVALHGVAALIELAAEPLYIIASAQLRFGLRAGVETAALLLRGALTLLLLARAPRLAPALAFSVAQLAASGATLLGYLAFGARLVAGGALRLAPRRWDADDRRTLRLAGVFTLQAVRDRGGGVPSLPWPALLEGVGRAVTSTSHHPNKQPNT